ncbi:oligosaccharide flippase family protein [Rhodococcus sp. NPDC077669]|uniref:oligosaccharide flippase family protein n=1 Tax=Rhodococcus sp. NPDC077669 TaxID=3155174 RepID=UPI00343675EB
MIAIGRLIALLFSLATVPIVARALGPDGRGIAASMLAIIAVGQVLFGLGIPLAVRRRVVSGEQRPDVMKTARLYAALTALPCLAIALLLDRAFFADQTLTTRVAFYISMMLIPLSISWAADVSVLVATKEYLRMAILGVTQAASSFVVIVSIWATGNLTISSVLYATLGGNIATFIMGLYWVRMKSGKIQDFWGMAREGSTLAGGQLAAIASGRIDQIMILPILGPTGAGLYSIALTVGTLPTPISQAVGASSFAAMSTGNQNHILRSIRQGAALCILTACILSVVAYFAIPIIFGDAFTEAVPAAIIMVTSSIFTGIAFIASMALAGQKKGTVMTAVQVAGLAVGLILLFPLSYILGIIGAALAMTTGAITTMILALNRLRLTPFDAIPRKHDWSKSIRELFKL